MDVEKLIKLLRYCATTYTMYDCSKCVRDNNGQCDEELMSQAALAIETLRADLARVTAERDAAVKDLNEFLSMDELCPIQCEWCKWKDTFCDGKTPEWRGIKED